jgi:hypothetical protein
MKRILLLSLITILLFAMLPFQVQAKSHVQIREVEMAHSPDGLVFLRYNLNVKTGMTTYFYVVNNSYVDAVFVHQLPKRDINSVLWTMEVPARTIMGRPISVKVRQLVIGWEYQDQDYIIRWGDYKNGK